MEIKVFWTDFAKQELKKIHDFYKKEASTNIAQKLVRKIEGATHILATHPNAGHKEELLAERKEGFRYIVHKNYKIIYWLNKEINQVEITDVFDTRQNPVKINTPR